MAAFDPKRPFKMSVGKVYFGIRNRSIIQATAIQQIGTALVPIERQTVSNPKKLLRLLHSDAMITCYHVHKFNLMCANRAKAARSS